MNRRAFIVGLMLMMAVVAAILIWWRGGIVAWLPVDLQYAHCLALDGQWQRTRHRTDLLGRVMVTVRAWRAERAYRAFLERHPDHIGARIMYGNFLADTGREDESAQQWMRVLQTNPNVAVAHNNLGEYWLHRGEIARAFAFFDRARQLEPNRAVYHYNWASAVFAYRKDAKEVYGWNVDEITTQSLEAFRKARDLEPHDFTYANAYAEMFYFTPEADWEAAYDAWQFCLKQNLTEPVRQRIYARLARVCMHLKRFDEAAEWLRKITLPEVASYRDALERKRIALLNGAPDNHPALQMMRAVRESPEPAQP